jgi:hypothetical protein
MEPQEKDVHGTSDQTGSRCLGKERLDQSSQSFIATTGQVFYFDIFGRGKIRE